ncbi:MAG TPA: MHYT domain-containing protein [Stellaceae bacterium]|nr:MHYT domain-containing protein [Stellaceae bacterium]
MLNPVFTCLIQQHDLRLVVLAGVVCLFACFTTTSLFGRAENAQEGRQIAWLAASAVVFGCGVWTTHFIAELAYRPGIPVGYDLGLTALSAVIAVLMSGLGVTVALRARRAAFGGALVGGAVGAMHYVGVAAMRFPGNLSWNAGYVVASLAIGVGLSALAFWVRARTPSLTVRSAAALLLVLAIVGLHFVGMTALSVVYDPTVAIPSAAIAPQYLAVAVAGVTAAIITIGLAGSIADERLTRQAIDEAARLHEKIDARTAELRQAQADLLCSERLSTIGQLTASIAHELRNPLSAIRNSLFTIREMAQAHGTDFERPLGRAERSIMRCARIIDDLVDYTHSRELHCAGMIADDWLETALAEQKLPPNVELRRDFWSRSSRVYWDAVRMRQVLTSLVENAAHAVSEREGEHRIAIGTRVSGELFELNGTGIPPEILGRVFEPLFTTKSFGTGLGLPLVKQIVEQHGGRIDIESAVGRGTTVIVRMPCLAAERSAA